MLVSRLATCIGCGCDDNHNCTDGCYWLRVDYRERKGVCSECEDHVEAWDRGDRTPHAAPIAEREDVAEGRVRTPRPEQPGKPGGCGGDHDWPFDDMQDSDQCRHCGMGFLRHVHTECP